MANSTSTGSKIDWQNIYSYAKNVHARVEIGFQIR